MTVPVYGNVILLEEHEGYGNLLAFLRNLPEMQEIYSAYCFEKGSRGRGNGKAALSPLGGSNIWLADEDECVIICQSQSGRGPLVVRVYTNNTDITGGSTYLSNNTWEIINKYDLPHIKSDPP